MPSRTVAPPATLARSAVVTAPGRVEVRPSAVPEPGPGEVLLRLEGCGVCGSNVPVWEGRPWFEYPLEPGAPGHEGWGRVAAVGAGVDERLLGRRVAALSYRAFAGHDVAPAEHVVELPSELEGTPFPGEALACAVNVFGRSDVRAGQTVAVVGVGFLGSLLVQLAGAAGAEVVEVRRDTPVDAYRERCERVLEAAGTQAALDTASQLVAAGGRLVIAGYHQDGPRTVDLQSWNWRGLDVVNAHERDPAVYAAGMREAVAAVLDGRIELEPLLTHRFPLERLGDALEAARARPPGFVKAWVEP